MNLKDRTIFIIGVGAIGKVLAIFLEKEGKRVILLRGHISNTPEYVENIEVELSNGEIIKSCIPVSSIDNYTTLKGIIVLTTKSFGNDLVAEKLKGKTGDSPIVVLQNGLHVEAPFIKLDFPEIFRCVLFATSQYVDTGKLRFKPASFSPIGLIKGSEENVAFVTQGLHNSYLTFQAEDNIEPIIWTKTIVNCVFNSICPLLEIDNGIFYRNKKALAIAKGIIHECIEMAVANGIFLSAEYVVDKLLQISKASDGQLISTYQDLINKRKTEIDTLNIAIADIADKLKKTHLVKRTKLLGELIQIKSEIAILT